MSSSVPSRAPAPVHVEADPIAKILRVHFCGTVCGMELGSELDRLAPLLANLGPGFSMITDLTDLQQMDLDCVPQVTRMMDLCLRAGVRQVIRVIPDPDKDIGFNLLSLTHYRGKVPIATCETRREAERKLSGKGGKLKG